METPTFLGDRSLQLLLFGGKGGVGKTTCATAAAFTLAGGLPDTSFLLVSIDPAHSLADCLGGILPPDNLTTLELDSQECLSRFKAKHHLELHEIVSRGTFLDERDIRQFLELSLPGLRGRPGAATEGVGKSLRDAPWPYVLGSAALSGGSARAKAPGSILERGEKAGRYSHDSPLSAPAMAGEGRRDCSTALPREIALDLRWQGWRR